MWTAKIYIQWRIFHTQVVLVCLQPFWCNSLLKCVSQPKIVKKFSKTAYFRDLRSFKVIDVDIPKKLL